MLNGFRLFSSNQQITATDVLLQQPLPYSMQVFKHRKVIFVFSQVKDVWKELAQESSQFYLIADYLLDLLGFPTSINEHDNTNDQVSTDSHHTNISSTNPTRKFFEVVDTGAGGPCVKLITNHLCAMLAALNELIKVSFLVATKIKWVVLERRA